MPNSPGRVPSSITVTFSLADFFAQHAGQERIVPVNRHAVDGFENMVQQAARGTRLENHRDFLRLHFHRVQAAQRAFGGGTSDQFRRVQIRETARQRVPGIALHRFARARHRRHAEGAIAGAVFARETARIGENMPPEMGVERGALGVVDARIEGLAPLLRRAWRGPP